MSKTFNFPSTGVPKRYGFWFKELRTNLRSIKNNYFESPSRHRGKELLLTPLMIGTCYIAFPLLVLALRYMFFKHYTETCGFVFENPDCIKELDALQKAYDVLNN